MNSSNEECSNVLNGCLNELDKVNNFIFGVII